MTDNLKSKLEAIKDPDALRAVISKLIEQRDEFANLAHGQNGYTADYLYDLDKIILEVLEGAE